MEQTKLTKAQVRLELLKLTYNNVHPVEEICSKTKKLEEFVTEGQEETKSESAGEQTSAQSGPQKGSGKDKKGKGDKSDLFN